MNKLIPIVYICFILNNFSSIYTNQETTKTDSITQISSPSHPSSRSLLTEAIKNKDFELIKQLLQKGVDAFVPDEQQEVPWLVALSLNDQKLVDFIKANIPKPEQQHMSSLLAPSKEHLKDK